MFIQTETTPNPATLKFLPGRPVLDGTTRDYRDAGAAGESPLARRLFEIGSVCGVYLADEPTLVAPDGPDPATAEEFFDQADAETVAAIKELIETRVRPAVAQDGGDIVFRGFADGVVFLNMHGACAGCPSSTMTLKQGIENLLRHFLPEVEEVRPV
jgi:Fe-S cluster biogenesis protein NfuA